MNKTENCLVEGEKIFPEFIGEFVDIIYRGEGVARREKAYIPPPLSSRLLSSVSDISIRELEDVLVKLYSICLRHLRMWVWRNGQSCKYTPEEKENFQRAFMEGWKSVNKRSEIDQHLIRKMHKILFSSAKESRKSPGEYRNCQESVCGWYYAPPPEYINKKMRELEDFINCSIIETSPIIQAGLVYAQFVLVHPFKDGNGRIASILVSLLLAKRNIIKHPLLYLHMFFDESGMDRDCFLGKISKCGNWHDWVLFYLRELDKVAKCQYKDFGEAEKQERAYEKRKEAWERSMC